MTSTTKLKMDAMRKSAGPAYLQTFLLDIFTCYVVWRLFQFTGTHNVRGGVEIAVFLCLGTIVVSKYTQKLFGQGNMQLFLIDGSFQIVCFAAIGAILGGWQMR